MTTETLRRQWQLLQSVPRAPKKVTVGTLFGELQAKGFPVARRTVERDLRWLTEVFALECDDRSRPHGWSWAREALPLDMPRLSSGEALSLLMTREHLHNLMPASTLAQLRHYFELAEQRLSPESAAPGAGASAAPEAQWRQRVRVVPATQPLLAPVVSAEVLAVVQQALLAQVQCEVTYQRRTEVKAATYPIHPLGLVQRGALLYVVCTIKSYSDIKLLTLHRIGQAQLLTAATRTPRGFDLDAYLNSGAMGWSSGASEVAVEVAFDSTTVEHLRESPLSRDQTLVDLPDGRVLLTATVTQTPQFVWWLRGFGPMVEVLAPTDLRMEIAQAAMQTAQIYGQLPVSE